MAGCNVCGNSYMNGMKLDCRRCPYAKETPEAKAIREWRELVYPNTGTSKGCPSYVHFMTQFGNGVN